MRKGILVLTAAILIFSVGCVSTNRRYQEADDVYVTESDRASERAEELAKRELEKMPKDSSATASEEEQDGQDDERKAREESRQNRRSSNSAGNRVIWYVIGGLIEIAFNVLLIWLFY